MTRTCRPLLLVLLLAAAASASGGLASCGGDDTQPSATPASSASPASTAASPGASNEQQAAIETVASSLEANGNIVDRSSATAVKLPRTQALDAFKERTAAGRTPFGPEIADVWVIEVRVELHPKALCEKHSLQNCDSDPEKDLGTWLQWVLPDGKLGPNAFRADPGQPLN